jgi:hypothetical protein
VVSVLVNISPCDFFFMILLGYNVCFVVVWQCSVGFSWITVNLSSPIGFLMFLFLLCKCNNCSLQLCFRYDKLFVDTLTFVCY